MGCKYCYYSKNEQIDNHSKDIDIKVLEETLNSINEYIQKEKPKKQISVGFVANGEPLLSIETIIKLIEFSKENLLHSKFNYYTVTNGTQMDEKTINLLEEHLDDLKLSFSLDGPKEIHDKYRVLRNQKGTFDIVIESMTKIKEITNTMPGINTTVTKELIENPIKFVDFLLDKDIKDVTLSRLVEVNQDYNISEDDYYKFMMEVYKYTKGTDVRVRNFRKIKEALQGNESYECTMYGSTCGAGYSNLVYIDRDVYPCGRYAGQKEHILGKHTDKVSNIQKRMCQRTKQKPIRFQDCIIDNNKSKYRDELIKRIGDEIV